MLFKKFPPRREIPVISPPPEQGLSARQAKERLACGWGNQVKNRAMRSEGQIILENCLTFFNLIFIIMAAALILVGSTIIKFTFLVVVVINTIIGCVQEIRAKRAVDKLTLVAAQTLPVIRDGKVCPLTSQQLVRDDIVEFSSGDQICADGMLRTGQLQVNEALVTGEADAIVKNPGDPLLSGSFVVAGRGRAQLTHVGNDAFAARLTAEAKKNPKVSKSEMMRALDKLIKVIGLALIPIGAVLFYQEYFVLRLDLRVSAEATAAALVGMVPEGLYLLTSIALAASSLKLSKKRVLVQDMNCIETLARVDVLCVDKTGTITQPVMELDSTIPLTGDTPAYFQSAMTALFGVREPENDTGKALFARFRGESSWICKQFFPFTSEKKWGGWVFDEQGAFIAGAPESILGSRYQELQETVTPLLEQGFRVLLVARYSADLAQDRLDTQQLTPFALLTLSNPIRPTAAQTFAYFKEQGVCIKVISGDNPQAVAAVAARAGIDNADRWVDTTTLETDEDIFRAAEHYTVFGRVTPDKKRALIRALKAHGHTVAMTGDGVNDVLAMKEAHCGIAMASGAQAASQVARLVLLDSDFSAMPDIVAEGRRVINNIQRTASLFLVKNIFSLGLSLISLFAVWPYPLQPQHMSIISGLTIGVPSFFLAMEPNYQRVQGRFLPGVLRRAFPGGLTNIFAVLAAQICMVAFSLPLSQISTVCTAILAVVGMLVLTQVCRPFDTFRKGIVAAMAVALAGCFTLLRSIFELYISGITAILVMTALLIVASTVFFIMQRLFDLGDKLWAKIKK